MSKILIPLHIAKLSATPTGVATGFKKFYLKGEWFKLYDGVEIDLVLDRTLENYTPINGIITDSDTVLTAIEKLAYQVSNITSSVTNTSDLINDGEDGINPFITALDIPSFVQVNSDWNAISGVEEILNKPTLLSQFTNDPGYLTISTLPPFSSDLQAVTDNGNESTNPIIIKNNSTNYTIYDKDSLYHYIDIGIRQRTYHSNTNEIQFTDSNGTISTFFYYDGRIVKTTNLYSNSIQFSPVGDSDLFYPTGSGILLKDSDLVTILTSTITDGDITHAPDGNAVFDALALKLDKNSSITGATKTKITYDSKGLVTSGADATTADIADSTNKRYVTDTQLVVIGNTSGTNTGDNATNSQYSGLASSKQDVLTDVNFGTFSNGLTDKTTPVDADTINIVDSADSNKSKKVTLTNFKAFLKTYFDTQYQPRVSFKLTDTVASSNLTGTTTETVMKSYTIAANSFAIGDFFNVKLHINYTTANAGYTRIQYLKVSNTNNYATANTVLQNNNSSANNYALLRNSLYFVSGNILRTVTSETSRTIDNGNFAVYPVDYSIDPTQPIYVWVGMKNGYTTDVGKFLSLSITN